MSDTTSSPSSAAAQPSPVQPASRRLHGPGVVQVAIVVAILGGGILLTNLTSDVTKATEPGVRVVNGEPYLEERAGRWVGGPQGGLAPEEREVLPGDTAGARRVYADVLSNQVACTIILAGKDVTSVHRPEMCLTGQGWQMQEEHVESVSDPAVPGGKIELMRMNATRQVRLTNGQTREIRSIFAYWFIGKNRMTAHHWQRILWNAQDRILHNTNHRWAYILIHAPVTADTSPPGLGRGPDETMQMIKDFVRAIYPTLTS